MSDDSSIFESDIKDIRNNFIEKTMDTLSLNSRVEFPKDEIKFWVENGVLYSEFKQETNKLVENIASGYYLKKSCLVEILNTMAESMKKDSFVSNKLSETLHKVFQTKESILVDNEDHLSAREIEVLTLLAHGMTSKKIAETLFISKRTVDGHRIKILAKTGEKSIIGLVKYATAKGFI